MAIERLWESIGPLSFTANGGADGTVTVSSTEGFKVKQSVAISGVSLPTLKLEVKRVVSTTKLIVGKSNQPGQFMHRQDLSAYTIGALSTIKAEEQSKSIPTPNDIIKAVYEQEPTLAFRTFGVDYWGRPWTSNNPFPVKLSDGNIDIGTVNAELEVQLSHKDNDPDAGDVHDSVRIGDGVNEATVTKAKVGSRAGLDVAVSNSLFSKPFTRLSVLTKNDDGDPLTIKSIYQGTDVQLMTITYDADGDFQDALVSDL